MEENLSGGSISLSGMLQWLVLQIGTNREVDEPASNSGDGARLDVMTVHRAKGDEFDFVLIPNTWTKVGPPQSAKTEVTVAASAGEKRAVRWRWRLPNGAFENSSKGDDLIWSLNTQETEREEARLLYVAMTRAKSNLTVFMHSYQRGQDITWGKMLDARNGVLP
jgi:ATP-dependent exoDNAse (exonuclease V) beta subunit